MYYANTLIKQWPVGQGEFNTQQINIYGDIKNKYFNLVKSINMVYDCGSSGPRLDLKKNIDKYIDLLNKSEVKKLDFLIISHFDMDHVNGLRYLIDEIYKS